MIRRFVFLIAFFWLMLSAGNSVATHLRAGEITAERTSCFTLTYRITVTVYIDTESGVQFGGPEDWLDFGDGNRVLVPAQQTVPRPDLGENMGMAQYVTTHIYSAARPQYLITYSEPNRNEFIVNLDNSGGTKFFLQTAIFLDITLSCNANLPKLNIAPIDKACVGVAFFHNPGAYDIDGDSLSYELAIPFQAPNTTVNNYVNPADPRFYVDYENGNETADGPPDFKITSDGTIEWNAPGKVGEFNIAFRITEWRRDLSGVYRRISYVTRDMQIIVEECDNERPELILPADTCVVAGAEINATILGTDPESNDVKIEVFSEILHFAAPATFSPNPPVYQSSVPNAQVQFNWKTNCDHIKDQYYDVVFKITDNPDEGPKLVTFRTWRIRVVGPAPEWEDATLDLSNRSAVLQWDDYTCNNASRMEVWRKVDGSSFEPGQCQTGMPDLGYQLVASVAMIDPTTQQPVTSYIDDNGGNGLAPGAAYCYRLVAVFPEPKGGESYVSQDTCLAPILADAPVITHVSIERTSADDGEIRVSWYSPFDIDKQQFPGPYEYEVYRSTSNAFSGAVTRVTPAGRITDTTFVDIGMDTDDQQYYYRIVLFSNTATDPTTWVKIDTSAIASSVWLLTDAAEQEIHLTWEAQVPWTNFSDEFPYHEIYRGLEGDDPTSFDLIDSTNVLMNSQFYLDAGKFNNLPLDPDQVYCYRVRTRGVYGNDRIMEPLENFSQVICARPADDVKPCAPQVSLKILNCDSLMVNNQCRLPEFSNTVRWSSECKKESRRYAVYASSGEDGEFVLIADNVKDTFFVDRNLTSFARCYKVRSIDNQGNESEWSETVCNDNCPYYELPNVFTPNGDQCNDVFSAYGPLNTSNPDAPESCIPTYDNIAKCLRFVNEVKFTVFNRWGKQVYHYESGRNDGSVYINWNGQSADGGKLAAGIYYYVAEVEFDVIDPGKRYTTLKGWVHITN